MNVTAVPHGTITGYTRHKCRCDECREAARLAQQRWRERNPEKSRANMARQSAKPEHRTRRRVYSRALYELAALHPEEFDRIYEALLRKEGL